MFEQLALSTTRDDIPTLIEVLRSPVLLKPTAAKMSISPSSLVGRINITPGGRVESLKQCVWKRPGETKRVLKLLSATYLQAAQQQRQQRLSDGLKFLNQQAPELETRKSQLQNELTQFRIRNSILEPIEEAVSLKNDIADFDEKVFELDLERSRLITARKQIEKGTITTKDFQKAISGIEGNDSNMSISDPDLAFLKEFTKAERSLGSKTRFSSSSLMVTD